MDLVATWGRNERGSLELGDSYIMSWRKEADDMYARHSACTVSCYTRLELTAADNG
jgi:hypothetical protein